MHRASNKVIGRLSLYRRLLDERAAQTAQGRGPGGNGNGNGDRNGHIFSHDLARLAGVTAAQVRRDVMTIGYTGSPARGYDVRELVDAIGRFLDPPGSHGIALVGVGNLGRALLSYFVSRAQHFSIVAAFDADPEKTNRVIHGVRCHPVDDLAAVVDDKDIREAIVAVPAPHAQDVATALCNAGVRGIVNFAPVRLWVPDGVYVENVDVTMTLERVSYFARDGVQTAK
jgi:redox-sensing transcriptional repressor